MTILDVLKCLLELCHPGKKQDVARKDLSKTCILVWSEVQLSIPFSHVPLKLVIRGKGRI